MATIDQFFILYHRTLVSVLIYLKCYKLNSNFKKKNCVLSSGREYVLLTELDYIMKKYFGPDLPPISQLEKRTKLALINANSVIDNLEPLLPNVIPVGGIHIQKAKPLPKVKLIFI